MSEINLVTSNFGAQAWNQLTLPPIPILKPREHASQVCCSGSGHHVLWQAERCTSEHLSVIVMAEALLQANGTTLGADNGIGVATAVALLDLPPSAEHPMPPLECLFTVDEETGLTGAFDLDAGLLSGIFESCGSYGVVLKAEPFRAMLLSHPSP